jgi:hypothetical protein
MPRVVSLLALGLAVTGCSGRLNASIDTAESPIAHELRAQMAAEQAFAWSADRRLLWSDFKGVPPSSGSSGALTAYSLLFGHRCTGARFDAGVAAVFLPHRSWVKPAVLVDPELNRRTLLHEQTHFDLTEVHARRMRKYFAELYDPCARGGEQARIGAERIVANEAESQARYDAESRHGLVDRGQRDWYAWVAVQLQTLDRYR